MRVICIRIVWEDYQEDVDTIPRLGYENQTHNQLVMQKHGENPQVHTKTAQIEPGAWQCVSYAYTSCGKTIRKVWTQSRGSGMNKRHKKAVDFEKCVETLEKKRMRSAKCVNMTVQHMK